MKQKVSEIIQYMGNKKENLENKAGCSIVIHGKVTLKICYIQNKFYCLLLVTQTSVRYNSPSASNILGISKCFSAISMARFIFPMGSSWIKEEDTASQI